MAEAPEADPLARLQLSPAQGEQIAAALAPFATGAALLVRATSDTLAAHDAPEKSVQNARRLLLDLPLAAWAAAGRLALDDLAPLGESIAEVAHRSDYLADVIASDAAPADLLLATIDDIGGALASPVGLLELRDELERRIAENAEAAAGREAALHDVVARFKLRHAVRIGLRDLFNFASIIEMMRELSDLSEAILQRVTADALTAVEREHGAPLAPAPLAPAPPTHADFCVVSMGKGGGRELNYSSDVDLVFVYSHEGATEGLPDTRNPTTRTRQIANHDFFKKVSEWIIGFLTRPAAGGMIYRVDMRLRPDGHLGPIARSLDSYKDYFALQARGWERVAYAKARAIVGPTDFGERVERTFASFVYAQIFNTEILPELRGLKVRIDNQATANQQRGIDIKRCAGGIREIEFLLVALQLLYANDIPELRLRRSTLGTLDALSQAGILSLEAADHLRQDYLFLRELEQRIQLFANRQTHVLPRLDNPAGHEAVARLWNDPPEVLEEQLWAVFDRVRAEFGQLFHDERAPMPEAMPLLQAILDERTPEPELLEQLRAYRLVERSSLEVIRRLNSGTREIYTTRRDKQFFEAIFAPLINVASRVPHPDAALRYLEDFLRGSRSSGAFFELLAEHPRTLEVILRTTGHGNFLAELFARHPEFVDQLLSPVTLGPGVLDTDHLDVLRRQMRVFRSPERRMRALRRHRELQSLLHGVRYVLGLDDWRETAAGLARLARQMLQAALEATAPEGVDAATGGLAVLGLGKIAVGEVNFFSDLDVVFVARDSSDQTTHWAERLIDMLGRPTEDGRAYELDARLRPMGRTAPLVPTAAGLVDYFAASAEVWEYLAFTRVTYLAGDHAIAAQVLGGIGATYRRLEPRLRDATDAGVVPSARAMRQRLEKSVGKLPAWAAANYKRGPGGLVDLEFARQLVTLAALARGEIALDADASAVSRVEEHLGGALGEAAELWLANYGALRELEAANRLLSGDAKDLLPKEEPRLTPLAFALGHGRAPQVMLDDYQRILVENRELFELACRAVVGPRT